MRFALIGMLVVFTTCGQSSRSPQSAGCWRLFDSLDDAEVTTEIETPKQIEDYLVDGSVICDSDLERLLADKGGRISDPAVDSILFENVTVSGAPSVSFAVLDSNSLRVHWLLFDLQRSLAADEAIFCIELPDAQSIDFRTDPNWLIDMLRKYSSSLRIAREDTRLGSSGLRTIQFEPTRKAIQILVGVVTRSQSIGPCRFRAMRLERTRGWQLTTARQAIGESTPLRQVELGSITQRCIALGTRGRVRAPVEIPARHPELRFSLGLLWQDSSADVRVKGRVSAPDGTVEIQFATALKPDSYGSASVDLSPVAGRSGTLELEFEMDGTRQQSLLVLGDISIEGLADPETAPPDLIVISLDTTRRDRMSLYGYGKNTTPEIDRFAQGAVVFDTAITAASWTLPSHTTMFSGEYPDRHGVFGSSSILLDDTPWLPEILHRRGYHTVAYTGGGYLEPVFGHGRGYDRYGTIDVAYPVRSWAEAEGDARMKSLAIASERERRSLLDFVSRPRRRPLYLFVHTYVAHNYSASMESLRDIGLTSEQAKPIMRTVDRKVASREYRSIGRLEREALKERANYSYDATVRDADRMVGELLSALDRSGRLASSVIVILSDHGEEIFDRDDIGHGQSVFDEQIRVPLIIKAPGVAARRVETQVSLVDLAPTLLEMLGFQTVDHSSDGRSLVPLLRGGALDNAPVISRGDRQGTIFRSIRGSSLKLIQNKPIGGDGTYALYDLRSDPSELEDIGNTRSADRGRLKDVLEASVRSLEKLRGRAGNIDLTGEIESELRELGYLGGDR